MKFLTNTGNNTPASHLFLVNPATFIVIQVYCKLGLILHLSYPLWINVFVPDRMFIIDILIPSIFWIYIFRELGYYISRLAN